MWTSLAVVAILLAAACADSRIPRPGCKHGTIIKHDCNTCICDEEGNWACTGLLCRRGKRDVTCSSEEMKNPLIKCPCVQKGHGSPEDRAQCLGHESEEELRLQRVKRADQMCEPGTTFMKDCNICKCNIQGNEAVCTHKICYKTCRPGIIRFVDCNACLCHQGQWKCTRKVCPGNPMSRFQRPKTVKGDTSICLPGDPTCASRQGFTCTPGTTYKDKCNTCWCGPDGKPGPCTRMDCPPGSYPLRAPPDPDHWM